MRRPCEYEAVSQITGSSTGAARQAEIDQHPQELGMRRISDNARLSAKIGANRHLISVESGK